MNAKLLAALSVVAVALAGCTGDDTDPNPSTSTPATSTPATSTPVTSTPVTTPPTNGTDDEPPTNDTGEMPEPKVCPPPPSTTAAPGSRMGYPELAFTVQEPQDEDDCFAFVGPENATAGWTAITLTNNGMSPHIMPMFRLEDGKTLEDVLAVFATGEEPEWAIPVGGVGFVTPFANGTVLLDLQPGTYLIVCFFEGHHAEGMYRTLNVTAATGNASAAPEADLTIELVDFGYEVPANLTAGSYVVEFFNNGTQPHEAPLVRLQGNTTMEQFLAAIENPTGPPPGAGVGGVNMLAPGQRAFAIVDFAEGNYGFVCFVEDPESGAPHVALGMATQFAVGPAATA